VPSASPDSMHRSSKKRAEVVVETLLLGSGNGKMLEVASTMLPSALKDTPSMSARDTRSKSALR